MRHGISCAAGKVANQLFTVLFQLSFVFPVRTAMPAVDVTCGLPKRMATAPMMIPTTNQLAHIPGHEHLRCLMFP